MSADRAGRFRRLGTNRNAPAPSFYTQALEFQTLQEQFVTCDDGSHAVHGFWRGFGRDVYDDTADRDEAGSSLGYQTAQMAVELV